MLRTNVEILLVNYQSRSWCDNTRCKMAAAYGVHIGASSACIAVFKVNIPILVLLVGPFFICRYQILYFTQHILCLKSLNSKGLHCWIFRYKIHVCRKVVNNQHKTCYSNTWPIPGSSYGSNTQYEIRG